MAVKPKSPAGYWVMVTPTGTLWATHGAYTERGISSCGLFSAPVAGPFKTADEALRYANAHRGRIWGPA